MVVMIQTTQITFTLHMQKEEEFINQSFAMLGEKGPEFVFDADTTARVR
jgi:hypothetical protein